MPISTEQIQTLEEAKIKIKQSRDNFRTLFDSIKNLIFILDRKGIILKVNKIVPDMLGYSEEEIVGQNVIFLYPQDQRKETESILADMSSVDIQTCRIPLITKGRIRVYVETTINTAIWNDKEVLLWISQDITEKTIIERMREEARKRAIIIKEITIAANRIDNLAELSEIILDRTLEFLDFERGGIYLRKENADVAEIFYSKNIDYKLMKKVRKINIHEEPHLSVFGTQKAIILGNYAEIRPYISQKYGIKALVSIPLIAGKVVIGALTIMKNSEYQFSDFERNTLITIGQELGNAIKKMQYRQQLQESRDNLEKRVKERTKDLITLTHKLQNEVYEKKKAEEKYRNLFENVGECILFLNPDEKILMVNKTSEKIFGLKKRSIIGTKFDKFVDAKNLSKVKNHTSISKKGRKSTYEIEIIRPDGEIRNIVVTATPQYDKKSVFIGTLGIFRDITEQKIAEKKSKELELKMFSQSKMASLGEIATGIAHEINQPLFYINTIIQTLLEDFELNDVDKKDAIQGLQNSEIQVQRIVSIIQHLRIFGRADDKYTVDVNLNEVMENSLLILGEKFKHHQIKLNKKIEKDLPDVQANPNQMEQVFLNLFQNSIHALEKNETDAEIEISITNDFQENCIILNFSDNGMGIPKEIKEQIFEPFFTTKEVGKGTGLGLSIVYGIVTDHGGEITCESEVGKRTNFRIVFPVKKID
ncbi:MAG: PAS domain S-box protein [Candidatus Cloacimonadota bacterium]|nr:PAS domain S-box protein [Candidatus Cloacimonadota bacterium]